MNPDRESPLAAPVLALAPELKTLGEDVTRALSKGDPRAMRLVLRRLRHLQARIRPHVPADLRPEPPGPECPDGTDDPGDPTLRQEIGQVLSRHGGASGSAARRRLQSGLRRLQLSEEINQAFRYLGRLLDAMAQASRRQYEQRYGQPLP